MTHQLTKNFSLQEFTATSYDVDNTLPSHLLPHAVRTCEKLEKIRAYLSEVAGRPCPIFISSGFRCLKLNRMLNSDDTSDHVKAAAADWTAPAFGTPYETALALQPMVNQLGIGQLILEYGRWIHTSTNLPVRPINRVITYTKSGVLVGIVKK